MYRIPCISALALLIALLLVFPLCVSAEADFYTEMPEYLRMTQKTDIEQVKKNIYIRRTYPTTANEAVNAEMRALIDDMLARSRENFSLARTDMTSTLDVGAVVSRTGTSYMSFLTIAAAARDHRQLSVDFDARVYDVSTGERILLTDVFPAGSEAWGILADAVNTQLTAAFPADEPDADALSALCSREALESAAFTMGAARLTLTYRADAVYPGKSTLLHVNIYYSDIRHLMTPAAHEQTDNSRFRMVALTYDDGPVRDSTRKVMDELRKGGAAATFFLIGRRIPKTMDLLARQQDSSYSVQSHTYAHNYPEDLTIPDIFTQKDQFISLITEVTGVPPTMMRSPGGMDLLYTKYEIGYPVIHWSLASGDSGNGKARTVAPRVLGQIGHGDIVLMHDLNGESPLYTAAIVERLNEQGYLCVTIEELFAAMGVPLEPNRVYFSPTRIDE